MIGDSNKKFGGGTTPTGTIQITENGTVDVTNYATADVNVKDIRISDKIDIGLFTPETNSFQYSVPHNLGRVPTGAIVFEAEGATIADIPNTSIVFEFMLLPLTGYSNFVYSVNATRDSYLSTNVGNNTYKPSFDENQVTFATGRYYGAMFLAGRKYQYIIF